MSYPEMPLPTVRVTLMRREGRRVSVREAELRFEGTISSHLLKGIQVATMRTGLPVDKELRLPPDLYRFTLEQMGGRRLRLLGFEPDGVVQEWLVDFL